jgi:predicted 3-demethylubiquinone-9 3-methyltransferase (glyoxalase superfamily)
MQKITTCLGYNNQAEEAAKFYTSLFPGSKIVKTTHYGPGQPMPEGTVLTVVFELDGRQYLALNGGEYFDGKFGEAMSLIVNCDTQEEIDRYWDALTSDGGKAGPCGWCTDRFGATWQIAPSKMEKWIGTPGEAANRVMQAMMQMGKIDIGELERAYEGK